MLTRILIVDDSELVRQGLRTVLRANPGWEICDEASDGLTAVEKFRDLHPHVVILDFQMPGLNGLEVTRHLAKAFPQVRVVILSMYSDEGYVSQALRAGASGYLLKRSARDELELAIRAVVQGQRYLSPPISAPKILEDSGAASPLKRLTPRQAQVLQLIAASKTTKQVALDLDISAKTVECHRAQLMERLDIHDIASLVRFAIKVGLLEIEDRPLLPQTRDSYGGEANLISTPGFLPT